MKILRKTANAVLYTHPISKSLNTNIGKYTFLDFRKNIFHPATNFTKSLIKTLFQSAVTPAWQTWKLNLMDLTKIYSKTHRLQKRNYATVRKKKIAQSEEPTSLKMFYITLK